jgi:hypothetical protein
MAVLSSRKLFLYSVVVVLLISGGLLYFMRETLQDIETTLADTILLEDFVINGEATHSNFLSIPVNAESKTKKENLQKKYKSSKEYHLANRPTFDSKKAQKQGYSKTSVLLMDELVKYTNDILLSKDTNKKIDLKKYPRVTKFFKYLEQRKAKTKVDLKKSSYFNFGNVNVSARQIVSEREGASECGYFDNPKPSKSKSWQTFGPFENAESVATSWGYHRSDIRGAGWTRTITWNENICGDGTFRDNAFPNRKMVSDNLSEPVGGYLIEQNYDGWSPRGEPNPEVYSSWVWPYTIWPSYVYWWHEEANI